MITLSDILCMKNAAMMNKGNQSRLKAVFKKADEGEQITVSFIGGSITMGCNASPMKENCYAALTASWFYDEFGKERVRYINAGIGATDSYLGVHRTDRDVLVHKPDIVIIEFAVNDERLLNQESYDSLIRKIYLSESSPAVLLLFLTQRNGMDNQKVQEEIGRYYDLPMISYRNAILPYLEDGRLLWSMIAEDEDGTHPANLGHFLIATLLTSYLEDAYEHRKEAEEESSLNPPFTSDRYQNATLYDNTNLLPTEAYSFEPITLKEAQFTNGWKTVDGGSIAFYLTGRNIGMIYYGTKDRLSGRFDVFVDGQKVETVDADFIGKWGSYADYKEILRSEEKQLHKVEIKMAEDSVAMQFTILGFTVS